jgi:molybdopterin-guanine dinucleotide biosynthesis protein MobB
MTMSDTPVVGFVAASGTGKTTLLTKLLPLLREQGLKVAVIKHTHHDFEVDQPGKDSYELRKAGANEMLIASGQRWALMADREWEGDPPLPYLLERLDRSALDLVLVEGFKHERLPKIELFRPSLGRPPLYPSDPDIITVAADGVLPEATELPVLDLNDVQAIAAFVVTTFLR